MQQQFDKKENPLNSQEAKPNFWQSLEHSQKIALIVLAVFVLLIMVAWSIQFRRSLTSSLEYKGDDSQQALTENGANQANDLKNKDTDGDGLSDWDELNIYQTSPYLEDSDSDGIKDGDEVKAGKNPNCAEGEDCAGQSATADLSGGKVAVPVIASELNIGDVLDEVNLDSSGIKNQADLDKVLAGQADAATLRDVLIKSGIKKADLDKISDADLLKSYQDQLKIK
jgi:hypothetical protein